MNNVDLGTRHAGVGCDPACVTQGPSRSGGRFGLFSLRERLARIGAVAESLAKTGLVRPTLRAGLCFASSAAPPGCSSGCLVAHGAALWIDPMDGMAYCSLCWVEQYGETPLVQPDYIWSAP